MSEPLGVVDCEAEWEDGGGSAVVAEEAVDCEGERERDSRDPRDAESGC